MKCSTPHLNTPVLCCLVADHDILDDGRADSLLRPQNWATDDGREYCISPPSIARLFIVTVQAYHVQGNWNQRSLL